MFVTFIHTKFPPLFQRRLTIAAGSFPVLGRLTLLSPFFPSSIQKPWKYKIFGAKPWFKWRRIARRFLQSFDFNKQIMYFLIRLHCCIFLSCFCFFGNLDRTTSTIICRRESTVVNYSWSPVEFCCLFHFFFMYWVIR